MYAKALCSEQAKDLAEDLLDSTDMYYEKAKAHFQDAYTNFKKVNHIKG